MVLQALLLGVSLASAAPAPKTVRSSPEQTLAAELRKLRQGREMDARRAMMGGEAEHLRDAVAAVSGAERKRLSARLPGMAEDPFNICRTLAACREAPISLHVEDHALADDAFLALARPWFRLQEARGKAVKVVVDPGQGVRLELQDLPALPVVTLSAEPAPTGGFDIIVEDGPRAAAAFAAERSALQTR